MENLLIVLAILAVAIVIIVPILERFGNPIAPADEEQQKQLNQKAKIMRFLMMFLLLAVTIKYFFDQ